MKNNKDILREMNEKMEKNEMYINMMICPKCSSPMRETETDDPEKFLKNYISSVSLKTIKRYLKNNNDIYPCYECDNEECKNVLADSSVLKKIHNNLVKIDTIKKTRLVASLLLLILIYSPLTLIISNKFVSEDFFLTTNFVIDFWLRLPLIIVAEFITTKYRDGIYDFKNWKEMMKRAGHFDLILGILAIIIPILRIFSY